MAEAFAALALATAELNGATASFVHVFCNPLIVPTNAAHADAPLWCFQVTDSTDQPTRVQLDDDIRKDNDAHVRGQPLFSFAKDKISDVLDPERVKKDDDVVEKLLPLIEKQGSSSVLPSCFESTVSSVTAPEDDSALLFFPMSVLSSTTQSIVKASTQSPTTTLTALSLINSKFARQLSLKQPQRRQRRQYFDTVGRRTPLLPTRRSLRLCRSHPRRHRRPPSTSHSPLQRRGGVDVCVCPDNTSHSPFTEARGRVSCQLSAHTHTSL